MKNFIPILLSAVWLLTACSIKQFPQTGYTIQPVALESLMRHKQIQLIDVRTLAEYQEGHIPGAHLIDVQQEAQFIQQIQTLDVNRPYVLYCRSGRRSKTAKDLMMQKGFKKVVDLQGGFMGWKGNTEK
ncbi:MAG: rhodanese-like domain-containing protein [Bacteroidota bacterium]